MVCVLLYLYMFSGFCYPPTKSEGYSLGVVRASVNSVRTSAVRPSVHTCRLSGTISQYLLVRFDSFLFVLILYVKVNSYGHVGMVSSPNHTFFPGQAWLSGWPVLCVHNFNCNWLQPFLNQQKEGNGRRNYFMINLHKSMGLERDHVLSVWFKTKLICWK